MAECEVCGKRAWVGNQKVESGKPKYLGGNGRKTRGITKRLFKPNLQKIRVSVAGQTTRKTVCVKCIRSGVVQKAIKRQLFTLAPS